MRKLLLPAVAAALAAVVAASAQPVPGLIQAKAQPGVQTAQADPAP